MLHKHPDRVRSVNVSFGKVHVFWPSVSAEEATVALLTEVDTVGLAKRRSGPRGEGGSLAQYVNDRGYVASSLTSVALGTVFRTAMAGTCEERPELAAAAIPLVIHIDVVPARGGEPVIRRLFEPLGYDVAVEQLPLDEQFPEWGPSRYHGVTLSATVRVADALTHLYVLLPVLDDDKHYWVAPDEIDKLLRRGGDWLAAHPDRDLIVRRYLRYRGRLTAEAIRRLSEEDGGSDDPDRDASQRDEEEASAEDVLSLNEQRLSAVSGAVRRLGARSVIDLGCGEGKLLQVLWRDGELTMVAGMDVSTRSLQTAARRLRYDQLSERQRQRLQLFQGALTYRDARLAGFDVATCIEVIEHLDLSRLDAWEQVVFGSARPGAVIVTTPNREYNVRWPSLPAGTVRHRDHRFEWTRAEFEAWANAVADRRGYRPTFEPIGPVDDEVGPPTQMAVFVR